MSDSLRSFLIAEEAPDGNWYEVLDTLNATRKNAVDERRLEWLYGRNPDGPAVVWSIRQSHTNEMAGFTVALPRRMVVNGCVQTCWNCADFSIRQQYRSLGLALKLRRLAKEGVDASRVRFLYAHPNEGMAVIHSRVGHFPVGRMIRYAKVLKTGAYLQSRLKSRIVGGVVGGMVDPILRLSAPETRHRPVAATQLLAASRFDDRFDDLFQRHGKTSTFIGVRDASYLNWRYAQNPLYQTETITAENGKDLLGYLLFVVQDGVANVKDLFPPCEPVVARDLIVALVRESRRRRLSSISVGLLEGNPLVPILNEFGFHERPDTSTMYSYVSPESPLHEAVKNPSSWFITVGDRDV